MVHNNPLTIGEKKQNIKPIKYRIMTKRKKTTYDEAKTKTVLKNEPLKPYKSVNSSNAWSENHEKRKKMTSYEEESEIVFSAELRYRLSKLFYGLKTKLK